MGCGALVLSSHDADQIQSIVRVLAESMIVLPFARWLEAVAMAGSASRTVAVLNLSLLRRVGSWSYAVYCLQIPFWCLYLIMTGRPVADKVFLPYEPWAVMAGLIVVAWLATCFVERPAQRWLQRRLCVPLPTQLAEQLVVSEPPSQEAAIPKYPPQRRDAWCPEIGRCLFVFRTLPYKQLRSEGRCLCVDPTDDAELTSTLCMALSCPCCIPRRECCCFNPFNPWAGFGNRYADWRTALV